MAVRSAHRSVFFWQAAYDAYLTGCCFAAAAVVGLGVGLDELKGMARGGETPACLAPVMNVVPVYRVVSEREVHRLRGKNQSFPPGLMIGQPAAKR